MEQATMVNRRVTIDRGRRWRSDPAEGDHGIPDIVPPTSFESENSTMTRFNRRQFIRRSRDLGLGTAAVTILSNARSVRATPASDKIVLAAVGCGGRSNGLTQGFLERDDCEYAYACDPNLPRAEDRAKPVSYTHLTLPTIVRECSSRWAPEG